MLIVLCLSVCRSFFFVYRILESESKTRSVPLVAAKLLEGLKLEELVLM